MSTILNKSVILIFARILNQAAMLVSPILLVRFLSVETYGQYREFILYAMALITLFKFSIPSSLTYFIPRYLDESDTIITNTILLLLLISASGLVIFFIFRSQIMSRTSYDFVLPLVLYVFFFLNFDILENYWVGLGRTEYVLIYTPLRTSVRLISLVMAAYFLGDILQILYVMVIVEIGKASLLVFWLWRIGLLRPRLFGASRLREQVDYFVPLGVASILLFANLRFGQFYISAILGSSALAIYTIGTYQIPLIGIIRSSVADAMFPDMVKLMLGGGLEGLYLWKKVTLYYFFLVIPVFTIFFYHAETFIRIIFTEQYIGATGILRIALLIMLRQCFDMGLPLRALNKNRYILYANVLALAFNVPLVFFLVPRIGLVGAAIAMVVADLTISMYLTYHILTMYKIKLSQFALWRKIGKLVLGTVVALPCLYATHILTFNDVISAVITSFGFGLVYFVIVGRANIPEINHLLSRMGAKIIAMVTV